MFGEKYTSLVVFFYFDILSKQFLFFHSKVFEKIVQQLSLRECVTITKKSIPKATRVLIKKGNKVLIQNGGGGGYGHPSERQKEKVFQMNY